jgi:predicted alpha/beta-fold hydrolase
MAEEDVTRPGGPAEPFAPRAFLRGGHAQTLAAALLPRRHALPGAEARLFNVEAGAADVQVLCHCHWQAERRRAATLVLLHGLEGSSDGQYILGTAGKAWAAGMNVVRMNMRNCGGTERLAPTLYHSGLSADLGAVVSELIREDKLERIFLAGFSMGGNITLKLAGEWGAETPPEVRALAAVSPAIDLAACADALHRPGNRLYEWNFLWGLKRRLRTKARLFPGRYETQGLVRLASVRDFDDRVTARYCGFTGADDYYARSSASRVLEHIARPTLILHSLDDPFVPLTAETRAKVLANPHLRLVETAGGGHCAFLAPANGYDGRWAERELVRFFAGI